MLRVGSFSPPRSVAASPSPLLAASGADATEAPGQGAEGIQVTLSSLGRARAAEKKNQDIDDSNLPDNIKYLLKMIRELKATIALKQAELQSLMQDDSLGDEERQVRLHGLQGEVSSFSASLSAASAELARALREAALDPEQMAEMLGLLNA